MKLLLILAGILAVQATPISRDCAGVYIKGKYYEKRIIQTGLDRPFLLAVDYETDTLYFNYNINELETKSARLNLNTNEITDIPGIPNGFSHAVDSENNVLYVGTNNGIYSYDFKTDQSEYYGAKGMYIWSLFFKDGVLYYSVYPSQNLYTITDGQSKKYKDLEHTKVHYFVLDNNNDMYFSNITGLYKQEKDSSEAVLYKRFKIIWALRALALDKNGDIYAGIQNGIYAVKKDEVRVDPIFPVDDLFGLAFDNDNNIIYADDSSLVRLIPSSKKCLTD